MLGLNVFGGEQLYLPLTGGRNLFTGQNRFAQTLYNNFEDREGKRHIRFVLVSRSETIYLLVSSASHTYVNYAMN